MQFGGIYGGFALGVPAALSALVDARASSPLVTTGLAVAIGQEHGDTRLWAGLAVGLLGVAISLAPELGSARVGVGIAVTLLGMLGLAGGTVLQKHWAGAADVAGRRGRAVGHRRRAGASRPWPSSAAASTSRAQLVLSLGWMAWGMGIVTLLLLVHLLRGHAASTVGALLLVVPAVTAIASAPGARRGAASGEPARDGGRDGRRRRGPPPRDVVAAPVAGRSRAPGLVARVVAGVPARLAAKRDLQPAPFVAGAPRTVVAYAVASAWIPCSIAGSAAIP